MVSAMDNLDTDWNQADCRPRPGGEWSAGLLTMNDMNATGLYVFSSKWEPGNKQEIQALSRRASNKQTQTVFNQYNEPLCAPDFYRQTERVSSSNVNERITVTVQ